MDYVFLFKEHFEWGDFCPADEIKVFAKNADALKYMRKRWEEISTKEIDPEDNEVEIKRSMIRCYNIFQDLNIILRVTKEKVL